MRSDVGNPPSNKGSYVIFAYNLAFFASMMIAKAVHHFADAGSLHSRVNEM
jgi:hypothetical protein